MRWLSALAAVASVAACAGRQPAEQVRPQPELAIPAGIPASASAVVVAALPESARELWTRGVFGHLEGARGADLQQELDGYLEDEVGVVVGGIRSAFAFAVPHGEHQAAFAAVLVGVEGSPRGERVRRHRHVDLVQVNGGDQIVAVAGDSFLFGDEAAVVASIDVLAGKAEPLATGTGLGRLLSEEVGSAYLAAAMDAATLADPDLQALGSEYGVESVVVALGRGSARAIARGDEDGLAAAADVIAAGLDMASAQLGAEKVRAKRDSPWEEALGVIYATHHIEAAIAALELRLEGGELVLELPLALDDATALSTVLGIGAAIVVPAVMSYVEEAQTGSPPEDAAEVGEDGTGRTEPSSVSVVRNTMEAARPKIRACYEAQLAKNPALGRGVVEFELRVQPSGSVSSVMLSRDDFAIDEMSACLASVGRELSFEALDNDEVVTVRYPVTLQSAED